MDRVFIENRYGPRARFIGTDIAGIYLDPRVPPALKGVDLIFLGEELTGLLAVAGGVAVEEHAGIEAADFAPALQ